MQSNKSKLSRHRIALGIAMGILIATYAANPMSLTASDTPSSISTEPTSNPDEPSSSTQQTVTAKAKKKTKTELANEEAEAVALDFDECIQAMKQIANGDPRRFERCNKSVLSRKSNAERYETSSLRISNNSSYEADVVCTQYLADGGKRNFHITRQPKSGEFRNSFNSATKCSFRGYDKKQGKLVVLKTIETLPKDLAIVFVESRSGKVSVKLDFDPAWPSRR